MVDYFIRGGFTMYPILFLSILALAIVLERSYYFYRLAKRPRPEVEHVIQAVSTGNWDKALSMVSKENSPVTRVLAAIVFNLSEGRRKAEVVEIATAVGSQVISDIESRIRLLPLVVRLAPLLGLLGTVTGMIQAFQVIEGVGGKVNAMALAGGIWEAMLTTAFGLSVAIPTAFGHFFLERRLDAWAAEVNMAASRVLSVVRDGGELAVREKKERWANVGEDSTA